MTEKRKLLEGEVLPLDSLGRIQAELQDTSDNPPGASGERLLDISNGLLGICTELRIIDRELERLRRKNPLSQAVEEATVVNAALEAIRAQEDKDEDE